MIAVVSLNPSVDRMLETARIECGGTNRVTLLREDAGGKGINVAVAAARLGLSVRCVGLLAEDGAERFDARLSAAGTAYRFVRVPGTVRVNTKVRDAEGVVTEFNERGETVPGMLINRARAMILKEAATCDYLVLTGSLPPGVPDDFYADLTANAPCPVVLDASGAPFVKALRERPCLVKPNWAELEAAVGRALPTRDAVIEAARGLTAMGVSLVAVSLGKDGALLTDGESVYVGGCADVEVASTVGAGDSMVAGMLRALAAGASLPEMLRSGVASASASVTLPGTQSPDQSLYMQYYEKTWVKRVVES